MGAYNPEGTEELTGNPAVDRNRQEGYLYWLAWISQNTVSVFNVHDATGPIRRVSVGGLNCQVFKAQTEDVGAPPGLADLLTTTLGDIGACNK